MNKLLYKLIMILLIAILFLNVTANHIFAVVQIVVRNVYLEKKAESEYHLQYYYEEYGEYIEINCPIVGFNNKTGFNVAYCLNRKKDGAEKQGYEVSIDNVLDNDKVWRVIKNGFPFKNETELGLQHRYDAYAVTKWAVYCVLGQAKVENFKAIEGDEEGIAMIKALKKLVEIGENGTETQPLEPLELEKVGDLKEEGDYVSQEYTVKAKTTYFSYTISSDVKLPDGCFVANLKGEKNKYFSPGENFKVMIPKEMIKQDLEIKIKIAGECKAYLVYEGKSNDEKKQDYAVTVGQDILARAETTLKIMSNKSKIQINKIEEETQKPIKGVKFGLYKGEELIQTKETDEKGQINFENLYAGNYTLKEIETSEKYILGEIKNDINIEYEENKEITITNKIKKGNLKIIKVDKDNQNLKLEGVKFVIYDEENNKLGNYITDKNGVIYIENLAVGKYRIKELETDKWHNIEIKEINTEIKYNETTEVEISNEAKKGQIKVIKIDSDDNKIRLKDVEFAVQDKQGNVLENIKTDENGEAITSEYSIKDYEKLYFKEIKTQDEYIIRDEIIEAKLEENRVKNITIENEKKKGNLRIIKKGEEYNSEDIPLKGVKFKVYNNITKSEIGEFETDENGEISINNMPIGEYIIKEIETNKWYMPNEEEIVVEVKYNTTTKVNIKNELKKGQIKLKKIDSENENIFLNNVVFEIQDKDGNVIETIKTDKNGEAKTKMYPLKDFEYLYIKEIKTNDKYVLDEDIKEIKLEEGKTSEIVIKNEKIKAKIKIIKTSKDENIINGKKAGSPIEGVEFEIYNSDNKYIETINTDSNGKAFSSNLEKGTYYIKETKTATDYILNKSIITANIENNNEEVIIKIENESKKPEISIEKSGSETADIGGDIEYDISVRNTGNTDLQAFTIKDYIPYEYVNVTDMKTGTYNQDIVYNLSYKTNLSDDYIVLMEDLNSKQNYEIDLKDEIAENEYITEIKLDFEKVDVGFCSNENPHITGIVKKEVKSEDVFTNVADVSANYNKYNVYDKSKWKTIAYKYLPKTGF